MAAFGYGFAAGFLSYFSVIAYRLNVSSLGVGLYEALMGLFRIIAMFGTGQLQNLIKGKTAEILSISVLVASAAPLMLVLGTFF